MKARAVFIAVSTWAFLACGGPPKQAAPAGKPLPDDTNETPTAASSPDIDAAQEALKKNDCATARGKAQAVLDKTPTSAEALFILGVCDDAEKQPEAAIDHYKAALAADAKLVSASVNLSADLVDAKLYDDAIAVVQASFKATDGAKGMVELHLNLAYAFKGKGDHKSAAKSFHNALVVQDAPGVRIDYANELVAIGDNDAAQGQFKNAIAKANGDVDVIAEAAVGLGAAGDAAGCVAALDKVVAQKSTPQFLTERAICKHKAKDLAGARKDAEAALAADATYWKALAAAAKYAEEAKDKKACKAHYDALVTLVKGKDELAALQAEAEKGAARCK